MKSSTLAHMPTLYSQQRCFNSYRVDAATACCATHATAFFPVTITGCSSLNVRHNRFISALHLSKNNPSLRFRVSIFGAFCVLDLIRRILMIPGTFSDISVSLPTLCGFQGRLACPTFLTISFDCFWWVLTFSGVFTVLFQHFGASVGPFRGPQRLFQHCSTQ